MFSLNFELAADVRENSAADVNNENLSFSNPSVTSCLQQTTTMSSIQILLVSRKKNAKRNKIGASKIIFYLLISISENNKSLGNHLLTI